MSQTIEVVVAANGETRVETKGFLGSECRQASLFIERALGQQINEVLKAEFHQTDTARQFVQEPE